MTESPSPQPELGSSLRPQHASQRGFQPEPHPQSQSHLHPQSQSQPQSVVGRFAPSPTGRMHLGNAFAALGAWLGARAAGERSGTGSRVLLRIEDIDTPRAVKDTDRWIMDDLAWLGFDWDGEPTYQSQRTDIYEEVLRLLGQQRLERREGVPVSVTATAAAATGGARLSQNGDGDQQRDPGGHSSRSDRSGHSVRGAGSGAESEQVISESLTYPCYCTRAQLRAASAPQESDGFVVYPGTCRHLAALASDSAVAGTRAPAIRLAMPADSADPRSQVHFTDRVFGEQSWNLTTQIGDIVLRRSDGLFAYQLAVVVDDYLQGVNQIVRGRDLLRSTAAQMWVREWVARVLSSAIPDAIPDTIPNSIPAPTPAPARTAPPSRTPALTPASAALRTPTHPEYAHLPLLLSEQHRRLAKRDRSLELATLRERGVRPERVIGYLAWLMGLTTWPEPCTPADLLAEFSWEKIRAAGLTDRQTDPSILAG